MIENVEMNLFCFVLQIHSMSREEIYLKMFKRWRLTWLLHWSDREKMVPFLFNRNPEQITWLTGKKPEQRTRTEELKKNSNNNKRGSGLSRLLSWPWTKQSARGAPLPRLETNPGGHPSCPSSSNHQGNEKSFLSLAEWKTHFEWIQTAFFFFFFAFPASWS